MKTCIFFLLAAFCSAFPEQPAEPATPQDPCLQACWEQTKTKLTADPQLAKFRPEELTTPEARTKIRTFLKAYIDGTAAVPAAFTNDEKWTKLCTISTEREACVAACPDSPRKEQSKKGGSFFKLGCDADFKAKVGCLADVNKEKSETCQTKCVPVAAKFTEFLAQRDANPTELVKPSKEILESLCKFVNCRFNCRKTDIVTKCQDAGFEQAKKLLSAASHFARGIYRRAGGDTATWPEICQGDKIIEPHDY